MQRLSDIELKVLSTRNSIESITFTFFILCSLSSIPLLWSSWKPLSPSGWLLLCAVGGLGALLQFLLGKCLNLFKASSVAPFAYTAFLWAISFDIFLWGDIPDWLGIMGALCIVIDGILASIASSFERDTPQLATQ